MLQCRQTCASTPSHGNQRLAQQTCKLLNTRCCKTAFLHRQSSLVQCTNCDYASALLRRSIPDKLMRERELPRTVFLIILVCVSMAAALLNAFATLPLLGLAATLSGLAFGGMQGLAPAITSEIFGMTHFATNYSLLQLGPATGAQHRAPQATLLHP